MNRRTFYNLLSRIIYQTIKVPHLQPFFLKVYDRAFRIYYNLEKYHQKDPWLFFSDFQQNRIKTILSFISDKKCARCLDVGCSNGYITSLIAPYCRHITGIDISNLAIQQAKKTYGNKKIYFVAQSIRTFKYTSNYDLVILGDMLYCLSEYLPDKIFKSTIKRLCLHVVAGGRLILTSYLPRSQKSDKFILGYSRKYIPFLKKLGFSIKREKVVSGVKEGRLFKDRVTLLTKSI